MNEDLRVERSIMLGWATLATAVAYILAVGLPTWLKLGLVSRAALSLASVAAFLWFIVAEVRLSRSLDELQRRIQLEALAIAFPASVLILISAGFADAAGISLGSLSYLKLWPLSVAIYFVALVVVRKRYQ